MPLLKTARGRSLPLGATALADGVNFALLCRHGTSVRLVLLPVEGDEPLAEILLDPIKHRTGDHWHILVAGLPPVFRYGWRVDGPRDRGHRFNPENILLDPSSTAVAEASALSGKKVRLFARGRPFGGGNEQARGGCKGRVRRAWGPRGAACSSAAPTIGTKTARRSRRSRTPSSTSCTCAASPAIPLRGQPIPEPLPVWWKKSPIFSSWA